MIIKNISGGVLNLSFMGFVTLADNSKIAIPNEYLLDVEALVTSGDLEIIERGNDSDQYLVKHEDIPYDTEITPPVATTVCGALDELYTRVLEMQPVGIVNESQLSFSATGAVITISSSSTNIEYYYDGVYGEIPTDTTVDITETIRGNYIYINSSGALAVMLESAVLDETWLFSYPIVAYAYWNGVETLISKICFGTVMDNSTKYAMYNTFGCWCQGENNFSGSFANASFSLNRGTLWLVDVPFYTAGAITQGRQYYRNGTTWLRSALQNEYYTLNAGQIRWDNSGVLTDMTPNYYAVSWVCATKDADAPIIFIMGQREDATLADAKKNNIFRNISVPGGPLKLLYKVIIQNTATPYVEAIDRRYMPDELEETPPELTDAQKGAVDGANNPSPTNVFATEADINDAGTYIIVEEYDCSAGLPATTANKEYFMCKIDGTGATKFDILYSNGILGGTCTILTHKTGRMIIPQKALPVCGLIAFQPYIWNSAAWVDLLPSRSVKYELTSVLLATVSSTNSIPAGSIILRIKINIITGYSGGTTIDIGTVGTPDYLVPNPDIDATTTGLIIIERLEPWLLTEALQVTLAGAPAVGESLICVEYI